MSIPARPPRKCAIVGDGIVTFGMHPGGVSGSMNSRSATWMGRSWVSLPVTVIRGGVWCTVSPESEVEAIVPSVVIPPSCCRKSRWNHSRRNSPSVMLRMPVSASFGIIAAISWSSISRRPSAPSRPARNSARAAWIGGVLSRLPTWSARNGGSMAAMPT